MKQGKNRRRLVIVDPGLQKRIVLAAAWPSCLCMGAVILLVGYLCSRLGREALESGAELPSLPWLFMVTAGVLVLAIGFVIWTSLRISHRVAGPTQNIRRVLERVRAGELDARIRLRDGDYLDAVADLVNAHLQWLEEHPPEGVAVPESTQAAEVANSPSGEPVPSQV